MTDTMIVVGIVLLAALMFLLRCYSRSTEPGDLPILAYISIVLVVAALAMQIAWKFG